MHQIRYFCLLCVICLYGSSRNMTRTNAARTSWIHGQLGLVYNSYKCEQPPLDCIGFVVSMNSCTSTRTRTRVNVNAPLFSVYKAIRENLRHHGKKSSKPGCLKFGAIILRRYWKIAFSEVQYLLAAPSIQKPIYSCTTSTNLLSRSKSALGPKSGWRRVSRPV